MGYVSNKEGVTDEYLTNAQYEIEQANRLYKARLSLKPLYDPKVSVRGLKPNSKRETMDKQFEVKKKRCAIITLVRQETYNTLTLETLTALKIPPPFNGDFNSIRVIVIGAEGKAFSTGHDLKEIGKKSEKKFLQALFLNVPN